MPDCYQCIRAVPDGQPFCGQCGTEIAAQTPPAEKTSWGGDRLPADAPTMRLRDVADFLKTEGSDFDEFLPIVVMSDAPRFGSEPIPAFRLLGMEEAEFNGKTWTRLIVRPTA